MKVGFIVLCFVRQVSLFSLFSGIRTHELCRVTVEFSLKSVVLKLVARKAYVACAMLHGFARKHIYYFKANVRESVISVMVVGAFQKDVSAALFRC
jgi:hypothetical protein